jgi:predicted phosphohydrolase
MNEFLDGATPAKMDVWAISDLHLSFARPERRERYAARWRDHATKLEQNWRASVGTDDLVLLPGDISMAHNHRDLQPDLEWLHRLPGTKVLAPGNHDLWWNGVEAIRPILRPSILAVDGDAIELNGMIICGASGTSVLPEYPSAGQTADEARGLARLHSALEDAQRLRSTPESPLLVLWHFPPFDGHGAPGPWVSRMEESQVTVCLFGHLHTAAQWATAVQGTIRGVRYACVAADAVGFRPLKIRLPTGRDQLSNRSR